MLPITELDDEGFEDIVHKVKKRIPLLCPQWTDYNAHDPGITFLELLAFMQELQQFHLDQTGVETEKQFLALLGMKPAGRKPSETVAVFTGLKQARFLPGHSRLYAGDCVFETLEARLLTPGRLLECIVEGEDGGSAVLDGGLLGPEGKSAYRLLDRYPGKGGSFYLRTDRLLLPHEEYRMYVEIAETPGRNPVEEDFIPLVRLELSVYDGAEFVPCIIVEDTTHQLLNSGELLFQTRCAMGETEKGYLLRLSIKEGEYDYAPEVSAILWNGVRADQRITYSHHQELLVPPGVQSVCADSWLAMHGCIELYREEEDGWHLLGETERRNGERGAVISFSYENTQGLCLHLVSYERGFEDKRLWEGDGFPNQQFMLDQGLIYDSVELLGESRREKGRMEYYQKVDHFYSSGPFDRHYTLDEVSGLVTFGDGERGVMPEGRLLVIGYAQTMGSRGNISPRQLEAMEDITLGALVTNRREARGGADTETIEDCFARFRVEREQLERCVTPEDYETVTAGVPGLCIDKVKAVLSGRKNPLDEDGDTNRISIVVRPGDDGSRPGLSWAYRLNIGQRLEKHRLLGTCVQVMAPEYVGVSLFAEIEAPPHYRGAEEQIRGRMENYFREELSGFGTRLTYSGFYEALDALECVADVRNLSFHTQGKGVQRMNNGDLQIPVNALLYLKKADCRIITSD